MSVKCIFCSEEIDRVKPKNFIRMPINDNHAEIHYFCDKCFKYISDFVHDNEEENIKVISKDKITIRTIMDLCKFASAYEARINFISDDGCYDYKCIKIDRDTYNNGYYDNKLLDKVVNNFSIFERLLVMEINEDDQKEG